MILTTHSFGDQITGLIFFEMRPVILFTTGIGKSKAALDFRGRGPLVRLKPVTAHAGPVEVCIIIDSSAFAAWFEVIDPKLLRAASSILMDLTVGTAVYEIAAKMLPGFRISVLPGHLRWLFFFDDAG